MKCNPRVPNGIPLILRGRSKCSPCAPAEARRWIFFDFSQGNLENLVGNLEGILRDFFLTHRTKAQKFRGKFRSIFRNKIRSSKKIFRAKLGEMRANSLNRDMFKPFRSHNGLLRWVFGRVFEAKPLCTGFKGVSLRETHLWEHFGRTDQIKTCAKPQTHDRKLSGANRYENEMV